MALKDKKTNKAVNEKTDKKASKKTNKKQKSKIINKTTINIATIILYIIAIVAFEILYCNAIFTVCRVCVYISFFVLYFIFKNKFIEESLKVSENKYKRIFIYLAIIATILAILLAIAIMMWNPLYKRAVAIMLITVALGTVFIIHVSNDLIKNIAVVVFTIGTVFSISTKFNHALDEKKHFMSALNLSYYNWDYGKNPVTDKSIEKLPQLSKFTTIDEFLKNDYKPEASREVVKEDIPSTPAEYNQLLYVIPAIGVWIAKLLGGSIIDVYILGRIFNLIFYGVLIAIAIKLIPYKKNIFMVIALMPMSLTLAASYSIDGVCIGLVFIFIAYCLKLKKEKETIGLKDFLILTALFMVMLLAKSMAYITVAFIIFMLPLIKTLKKNKKYLPIIIAISIIACIVIVALAMYVKNTKIISDTRMEGNISVSGQINNMINHPLFVVRVLLLHINNTLLNFTWLSYLHQMTFFGTTSMQVMLIMMMFILYVSITDDDYNFKIKDKVIMATSFMLTFLMTSLILYISFSEVGGLGIGGYQPRYLIPVLPLLLFGVSNNRVKSISGKNRNMNICIASAIFIVIGIVQSIIV